MSRHSFAGAPALTYLTGSINSSVTTLAVASTAGWPDTSIGEFVIVVDSEKMLCSAYTSMSVTVDERGYDGTTAVGHDPGAIGQVFPCLDATQFDLHDEFVAKNGTVTPTTSAVGDVAADGSSQWSAAADHKHGREVFATGATSHSAPGDAGANGTSVSPARADHQHPRGTALSEAEPMFGAKGDLLVGTGSGSGALFNVGANRTVLIADSTQPEGVAWGYPNLTILAGHLSADYNCTGTLATFMSTASLGVGVWRVTAVMNVNTPGGGLQLTTAPGAGTSATFEGKYSSQIAQSLLVDATFEFFATVSVAGTLVFQAVGAGGPVVKAATPTNAYTNATGWTATKLA